ncbi:MAG: hypothetical protein PHF84_04630, partial [bacterium]|nr:hypothetical protein [bacterium]
MRSLIILLLVLMIPVSGLFPVTSISGPKFLTLKFSPKINSLGGVYTALYNDIDALEENPAGTVFARSFNINLIATKWIADINYFSAKSIIPLHIRKVKVLNLLATSGVFFYPSVKHYDIAGLAQEDVSMTEGYAGLGVSTILFDFLHAGIIFKYVFRNIYEKNYPALAFDLGIQTPYLLKTSVINLGLALRNVGYDFNDDKLPTEIALGLSKDFPAIGLLLKLDIGTTGLNDAEEVGREMFVSFGVEYNLLDTVFIRTGVKYNQDGFYPSLGLGSGLRPFSRWNLYWSLDYVYLPKFGIDEYNNHQISIGIRLYTHEEKQENLIFFEKYERKANLAYLKGDLETAIKFWEQALRFKSSDKVKRMLEQT